MWTTIIRILKRLLKFARRMFCKHHYVHLGSDRKIDKFYYWICTKCEKEKRTRKLIKSKEKCMLNYIICRWIEENGRLLLEEIYSFNDMKSAFVELQRLIKNQISQEEQSYLTIVDIKTLEFINGK